MPTARAATSPKVYRVCDELSYNRAARRLHCPLLCDTEFGDPHTITIDAGPADALSPRHSARSRVLGGLEAQPAAAMRE